jgi:hypothetical protein
MNHGHDAREGVAEMARVTVTCPRCGFASIQRRDDGVTQEQCVACDVDQDESRKKRATYKRRRDNILKGFGL